MNKQRYIALLQDPSAVTKADIPDIEELIAQFPYCQNAHILLAKIQHELGSMHAAKLTRKAALYTSDRTKLKRLLNPVSPVKTNFVEEKTTPLLPEENKVVAEAPLPSIQIDVIVEPTEKEAVAPAIEIPEYIPTSSLETTAETPKFKNIKNEADKHAANFLTELEENLKALHESKVRAANLFNDATKKSTTKVEPVKEEKTKIEPIAEITAPAIENTVPAVSLPENPVSPIQEEVIQAAEQTPQAIAEIPETDFFSTLEDKPKPEEPTKKSYASLIEAEAPHKDLGKGNDVLDLILSFDNRVKDYFDINEYSSKDKTDISSEETPINPPQVHSDASAYQIPFTNSDWKLEESRLEEPGNNSSSLLLNYLEYLKDQKNKKLQPDKKREKSIISRFIEKDPMISPLTYSESHSEDENSDESTSNQGKPAFISETFAKLLEKQGKIQKAIVVYEELILKNPEKNSYFASLIQELKKKL